ncbi:MULTISPECIES: AEC family transporter [unclassified Marinobacterium]|uniref:AEC family transporter n=1 Tax=unclassified Marinobacterium TaxID=2644139 RepID=UPI00156A5746|nr:MULTISPECIES: AEC family transporter [unclassified Marinobacterium]NRP47922.1 Membrane transport protein [Marinobacterium sp. xm-d-543]NRQ24161.1 Membrane transport protein [Marinobacterium sp. xm-m-312]
MNHLELLAQIFAVTAPIFSLVIIGLVLKRLHLLSDEFISGASLLVYKATLPTLLGMAVLKANVPALLESKLFGFYILATFLTTLICWIIAARWIRSDQRAVFIQAAFRGNQGIIALALTLSFYGDQALQMAGLMAGISGVVNNAIAVVVFSVLSTRYRPTPMKVAKEVVLNPMIVGVMIGVVLSLSGLQLPKWLIHSGELFGSMTLPLALLCIGATLSFKAFQTTGVLAVHATLTKLVWVPMLFTAVGWYIGISGMELGVLFLFLAAPTAAASYVMAKISGDDAELAANVIVLTTFASMFTITLGLYILQVLAWI